MSLACLLISACAEDASPDLTAENQVNAFNEQFMNGKTTTSESYKGEPWATSSLNDSTKKSSGTSSAVSVTSVQTQSSDYISKCNSFLKDAANNGYYVIPVSEYINQNAANQNWAIVDARSSELYAAGHIPGAISIPLGNLISQMGIIPAGKKVIVYCDMDSNAAFAVQALRVFGDREAYILQGGVEAWTGSGMTLET